MFLLVSTLHNYPILPLLAVRFAMGFFEYSFKQYTTMKEFLNMMEKDYQVEDFTKKEIVVFGIIAPIIIFAILAIIGWLDSKGMSGAY